MTEVDKESNKQTKTSEESEKIPPENKKKRPSPQNSEQSLPESSVEHWKLVPFTPGDMPAPLLEESSFATLFPKYREKYLKEIWPLLTQELTKYGISCTLDLREGSMTVRTTRKTWDPFAIINARDMLKLLSRSVPYQQAIKIFDDEISCDVIKIGIFTNNKEKFVKRRQRLIGPKGQTLKAIELLTKCYVMVQGSTVAAMGPFTGLKQVRKIVEECMTNIHPVYNIKALMVKQELSKNPEMAHENWERFLPNFKKKNIKKKVKKIKKKKKKYTPFPPPPTPSKIDLELESGEYFLKQSEREAMRMKEKRQKKVEKAVQRNTEREKSFKPPKEEKKKPEEETVDDLKTTIEKIKVTGTKRKNNTVDTVDDYLVQTKKKKHQ